MQIDQTLPVYPYLQVAAQIREKIASGEYAGKLPSYTELEALTGLSRRTVQRAVGVLVDEGLVEPVKGLGLFVKRGTS